ncbi:hypothetical protein EGT74_19305 [Chitinophaga lutea]|uniref:Chromosome segregation protein SMC n=1 Tax=Chitinophaga lutea TaxID=2488634 RepID=A0A3N4PQZ2_9BACT|nr:hypothetical protein [Chitinophaga lutea]RPE09159.1 hypothetical protein EGT74_19305 [Chitinophaga lutea]
MTYRLLTSALAFLLVLLYTTAAAQTAGTSILVSIESKASQIAANDEKVAELNRKRMDSYAAETEKLQQLKQQLKDLQAEKVRALYELENGFYCSQCNTPKSQFEARGESFTAHLRSVNGRAVPAKPEVVKAKMDEYDRRISDLEAAIKKFETEENEFTRKRADLDRQINDLKAASEKLCEEIVSLSKSYKEKVLEEAKSMHLFWAGDLMRTAAEKHFVEDRINILQVKLNDLAAEESKAVSELKDKVARKVEEEKNNLRNKVAANNQRLPELDRTYRDRAARLNTELTQWNTRLQAVNTELAANKFTADDLPKLQAEKSDLETKISAGREQLAAYEAAYNKEHQAILDENKSMNDRIWDLTVNLSKAQDAALEGLRNAFAAKRKILQDGIAGRSAYLQSLGSTLLSKKEASRQKHLQYASKVDAERIRLLRACQKGGCSCYGTDTHGEVNANWNRTMGCIGEMEGAHFSGDPVYGCIEEGALYKQHYNSLLGGLSDSDLEALQRTNSKVRYDLILKKVTN